jgi:hypothetical protein
VSTQRLRTIFKDVLIMAATGVATLLVVEAILRFLPVATAPPVEPPTAMNPIQRYAPNTPYTWSLGWDFYAVIRGTSNSQGFLANYDYDAKATTPLVAVVGDSMMEALHISFVDSLTGRLQRALGSRGRAYVFAQSGAPLSQYVAYAHHACTVYKPDRLIVSIVGNDFDESVSTKRLRDGFFHLYERPDHGFDHKLTPWHPPSFVERVSRNSSLALYFARNLSVRSLGSWFRPSAGNSDTERTNATTGQNSGRPAEKAPSEVEQSIENAPNEVAQPVETIPNELKQYVGMTPAAASEQRLDEGYRVIAWFLDALPQQACLESRNIILIVDAPRPHIYEAITLAYARTSYFGKMRHSLIEQAKARDFKVIDLEPVFLASFAADGQRFEYPTDPHWNPHAHEVVAAATLEALASWLPLISQRSNR